MRPEIILRTAMLDDATATVVAHAQEGYLDLSPDVAGEAAGAITCMEEPGRRVGILIAAGNPRNALARAEVIDAATAVANTPGGGVIIVGATAGTGQIIGTCLDADFLVRGLERARMAATATVHHACGQRLVALTIVPSRLPLANSRGLVTWRVTGEETTTDRFTWWQAHADAAQCDPMAASSSARLSDAREEAVALARGLRPRLSKLSPQLFVRHIGALHADGMLSEAGKVLLCELGFPAVVIVRDGQVLAPPADTSALEQLVFAQRALQDAHPTTPEGAYREALLNGFVHRDWSTQDPTVVTIEQERLTVTSPGGFHGGVTPTTATSRHDAKSPALTDLFRELHLLDKQISGIQRMLYRMVFAGYAPPTWQEVDAGSGRAVQCVFDTRRRDDVVADMVRDIVPADRAFDHRLALLVYYLRRHEDIDVATAAGLLSANLQDAWEALRAACQTACGGRQLVVADVPEEELTPAPRGEVRFRLYHHA
ncbi:hypothetical protein C1Y63_11805 [Corynebacterium sp. 13CS0277]|uniref:ATP-binding protein n=1 Tax=Corynebacterium sp. 13CS0277 TaxID=2071994 RepID=UPI000D031345|nr:ATP-binding protein [Corynebacterium sp. 13CS0277]PRQ10376.1 hypothetical protein C1Y63_11805 [Corynebacterium sp. 13CS0277]